MKLGLLEWIKTSVSCGRSTFELRTPSGDPLFVGAHHEALAEELRQLAEEDARTLSGKALVYTVWAKSEDGRSSSRYTLELAGGRETSEGLPDAASISNQQAAFGHLARLVIETNKTMQALARDVAQARASEVNDLRAIFAKYVRMAGKHGEEALTLKALEIEEAHAKAKGDALGKMAEGAMPLALGLAARFGLLPAAPAPGAPAAANAVDVFLSSLTPDQGERLLAILGPARAATVLRARGPNAARTLVVVFLNETTDAEKQQLLGMLKPDQLQALNGLFRGVEQQVDEEAKKAAAANGVGHPNGASA